MLRRYRRYSATHTQPDAVRDSIARDDRTDTHRATSGTHSATVTDQHALHYTCPGNGHA